MNIWHDISPKEITKDSFTAVIEIPKGSKVKYELDKATGLLRMDRILYTLKSLMFQEVVATIHINICKT